MPSRVLKAPAVLFVDPLERMARHRDVESRHRADVEAAYQAGLQDGRASGTGAIPSMVAALDQAAAQVASATRARHADDVGALLDVAAELAQWLVGRELSEDPTAVVSLLDQLVADFPSTDALTVRVAPELVPVVEAEWATRAGAVVVADPALAAGEVELATPVTTASLRFAAALATARRLLAHDGRVDDGGADA